MLDIGEISSRLTLGQDGIWYGDEEHGISYPDDGSDTYFSIEDDSFWFRHRNDCIVAVVSALPPEGDGEIFDIGGGNGFVASGLIKAGHDVVLVEPSRSGVINAKSRGVKSIICASLSASDFKPESLPAVGLFDVIEHIEGDKDFLCSIRELMMLGGRLYATVPLHSVLWSDEDVTAGHYRRYSVDGISEVLREAGFQIEFTSCFFRFLTIPIFLFRALPYRLGGPKKAAQVADASNAHQSKNKLVRGILNLLLRSEVQALASKKAMRYGASCLIVARNPL